MKNLSNLLVKIDIELSGLSYIADGRNDLSIALFDIAIEHSKAIVLLFENSLYASSYALVRPMFESFIRAAWIQDCACDEQIARIRKKDDFPLSLGRMLESVEEAKNWPGTLSNIKKVALKNMHSYTHGGSQLIARRFKNGDLVHAIDSEELDGVKQFVAIIAFLSFNEIVFIAKTPNKDNFIKELYDDVCRWYFPKNDQ
jgi:hypothetical protein